MEFGQIEEASLREYHKEWIEEGKDSDDLNGMLLSEVIEIGRRMPAAGRGRVDVVPIAVRCSRQDALDLAILSMQRGGLTVKLNEKLHSVRYGSDADLHELPEGVLFPEELRSGGGSIKHHRYVYYACGLDAPYVLHEGFILPDGKLAELDWTDEKGDIYGDRQSTDVREFDTSGSEVSVSEEVSGLPGGAD